MARKPKETFVAIEIGKDHRLATDEIQWLAQKFDFIDKDGERKYRTISWHPTMKGAADSLAHRLLRHSGAKNAAQLQTCAKEIAELFSESLNNIKHNIVEIKSGD